MRPFANPDLKRQLLAFAAVGVINTIVGVAAILAAFHLFGLGPYLSNAVGYGVGFVVSYVLHRRVTFQSRAPARRSLPRYALVLGAGYALNLGVLRVGLLAGWPLVLAQLCALLSFSAFVFVASRAFAFDAAR